MVEKCVKILALTSISKERDCGIFAIQCHWILSFLFFISIYHQILSFTADFSRVLEVRPARRTDASAPLSAGVASPPTCWPWGGENLLHLSPPVKERVQ